MRRSLLSVVLLAGLVAGCAPPPPPDQAPSDRAPPDQAPADQAGLPAGADRPPADPRYVELLEQAQRDGAAVTRERMVALRWAWTRSTDFDPIMPTRLHRAARLRADDDCARAAPAARGVLAIHWLDLRAHAVLADCARRGGDAAAAALHGAVRDATIAAMRASGDGGGPGAAMTVISVDEQYALLEILGLRRTRVVLVERAGRRFDVLEVTGGAETRRLWFQIDALFEFYERRFPRGPALRRA